MSITKPLPFRTTEKIYQVMYSRASARKFKKWECDGFLIYKYDEYFNGDDSCLSLVKKLDSGKQPVFENKSLDLADREQEFEPGYQCCMGGYDLEIQELLKKTVKENKHARQRPEEEEDSGDAGSTGGEDRLADNSESGIDKSDVAEFFPQAPSARKGNSAETGFVRPSLSMQIVPAPTTRQIAQKRKKNNEPLRPQANGDGGLDMSFSFSFDSARPFDPSLAQEQEDNSDNFEAKKRREMDPIQLVIGRQLPVDLAENLKAYGDAAKGGVNPVVPSNQKDSVVCDQSLDNYSSRDGDGSAPDFIPESQAA